MSVMARVLLDVTNYLDWDQEALVFLPGQEERLTAGLNLTYSVDTGFANVFGNPHLEFVGSREDLVQLINRWAPGDDEEAVEERKIAVDDIEDTHVDVCHANRGGTCNCYVGYSQGKRDVR